MTTPPAPGTPMETPLLERLRASTAGRYVIHAELGVGGMATVFRATEVALEREVAIKVMSSEMASSHGAFERFRREARVAAALSHPHIVPIYAIGEDPALPWFAMKFIEGRGLDAILRKEGARSIEETARTIGVVGKALHYAHERGVVHRDVKPANIMVGNDGWTYVTDFGIAKRDDAHQLTQAGSIIGTPAYMSPEQFNGQAITGAADQYSLGVVAFEMLTGRAPFDGPSLGEVMRGHLLEPPPPIRTLRIDVPIAVAEIVNRMLAKEPAQRFATLGEAAEALEQAAAGMKGAAGRVPPRSSATAPAAGAAAPLAHAGPTTPIPRPPSTLTTTGGARRATTAERSRPAAPASSGWSGVLIFLVLLLAAGGTGFYLFRDRIMAAISPPVVARADSAAGTGPLAGAGLDSLSDSARADSTPLSDSLAAVTSGGTTGATTGVTDSAATQRSIDSAIAVLAARVAAAPVIDQQAPPDSVIIRVGSDVLQTVLFVNETQIGIIGGRGLMETNVVPGTISLSIRKLNCRSWDTTFTGQAGRRYTLVGRSPTC